MLGYGLTKTKFLVLSGQIRSIKDGAYRRILPEWVDDYIRRCVEEQHDIAAPDLFAQPCCRFGVSRDVNDSAAVSSGLRPGSQIGRELAQDDATNKRPHL